jgi:release factor glutamine methyltransferase
MNKKFQTFTFKGLTIETHPEVYDPSEDTFFLVEVLDIKEGIYVLEIGSGCGIIALDCARKGANVICTDINPIAVELTKKNYLMNQNLLKGDFEVRLGDLFSPILSAESFDVIVFNPPYLPTKKDEKVSKWFDIATSGGPNGLAATERFLKSLDKYLKENGKSYFVFSTLSDRNKLEKLLKKFNLNYNIVKSNTFDDETLDIYCINKKIKD